MLSALLFKLMLWLAAAGLSPVNCRSINPRVLLEEYLAPETRDLLKGIASEAARIPYSRKVNPPRRGTFEMETTFFEILMGAASRLVQLPECSYCGRDKACRFRCARALTKILVRLVWPSKRSVRGDQCANRFVNGVHIPFYYSDRCIQRPRGARDFHLSDEFIPKLTGSDPAGRQEKDLKMSEPCQFINVIDPKCTLPSITLDDVKALGIDTETLVRGGVGGVSYPHPSQRSSSPFPTNGEGRGPANSLKEELHRLLVVELPVDLQALGEFVASVPNHLLPALLTNISSLAQSLPLVERTKVALLLGRFGNTELGRHLLAGSTECDDFVRGLYNIYFDQVEVAQGRRLPSSALSCKRCIQAAGQRMPSPKLLLQMETILNETNCHAAAESPSCLKIRQAIYSLVGSLPQSSLPSGDFYGLRQLMLP